MPQQYFNASKVVAESSTSSARLEIGKLKALAAATVTNGMNRCRLAEFFVALPKFRRR